VITIEPGVGALAFCAVVILTMFAAETFDPRLMWDAAAQREPAAIQEDPGFAASDWWANRGDLPDRARKQNIL
jgi:paraquat-inducible protein A